jgi:hypothetical protein
MTRKIEQDQKTNYQQLAIIQATRNKKLTDLAAHMNIQLDT